MVFSSVVFLFYFLPASVVLGIIFKNTKYLKNIVLLVLSLLFYGWGEPKYIYILLISIAINYCT